MSTNAVGQLGDQRWAKIARLHDERARDLLRRHAGREIDRTDGFFLVFDRPYDAVLYALDYHQSLEVISGEVNYEVTARIAIHFGEVYEWDNIPEDVMRGAKPLEIEGFAKSVAARLMSLAGSRQTLLTREAYDLAYRSAKGEAGAERLEWRHHGPYNLWGVDELVEVFEVGLADLSPLKPPADSEKAWRATDPTMPPQIGPWKLVRVEVENLRAFKCLAFDLRGGERTKEGQWVLLLGDNGVGKTTLLCAIGLACLEEQTAGAFLESAGASFIRHDAGSAQVRLHLADGEYAFSISSKRGSEHLDRLLTYVQPWPVFGYGCQRGTALGGPDRDVNFKTIDNVRTLFDDQGHLVHAETWLKGLQLEARMSGRAAFFDAVCATLVAVLPGVELVDTGQNGQIWLSGPKVERVPLAAMSDGYVTTAGWVIDLIARWAEWSRRHGIELDGDFREKMTGIVLIDEIDLHLHPQWQVEVVSILRAQFPRLSFIATTHNPLTLLGSQPGEVHLLRRHPETNEVVIEQIDVPPGSRTDQVLTGTWFGLSSTVDPETRSLLAMHRGMLREGVPRNDERRKALEDEIRERTGTFAETSVERLVHSVAAELIAEGFEEKSPAERKALREEILVEARRRRQNASP